MSEIRDIIDTICASLWFKEATAEELKRREFLKNTSLYGIEKFLQMAENKGLIYYKKETAFCYKKTAKELNKKGYELDLKEDLRSDFRKSFDKSQDFF